MLVAGFSPRFHNVAVGAPRAKARDYIREETYCFELLLPFHSVHQPAFYDFDKEEVCSRREGQE